VSSLEGEPILRFTVDAERATVGSGAHCEVRLPPEVVAREQLLLTVANGALRFEERTREVSVVLRGARVAQGVLGPADELQIGSVKLSACVVSLTSERRRFPLEALAVIPAALVVALALTFSPKAEAADRPPTAPPLFADTAAACPAKDPAEAGHVALQRRALAVAKRERGPFAVRDSVEAVTQFGVAAACARLAGDDAKASEDAASAEALRRKVEDEYLTRRTRLEHAFLEGDTAGVDRELPALVALTAHLRDPYVDWLIQENRRAELAAKQPKSSLL
jgi:hypothetical protein